MTLKQEYALVFLVKNLAESKVRQLKSLISNGAFTGERLDAVLGDAVLGEINTLEKCVEKLKD